MSARCSRSGTWITLGADLLRVAPENPWSSCVLYAHFSLQIFFSAKLPRCSYFLSSELKLERRCLAEKFRCTGFHSPSARGLSSKIWSWSLSNQELFTRTRLDSALVAVSSEGCFGEPQQGNLPSHHAITDVCVSPAFSLKWVSRRELHRSGEDYNFQVSRLCCLQGLYKINLQLPGKVASDPQVHLS